MTDMGIYLDNNAGTRPAPAAVQALCEYLREDCANPSSKHAPGERARRRVNAARAQVAKLLGATPAEIVFTSGGTESIHTAVLGALALAPHKNHIVTSGVEHPAQLQLLRHLEHHGVRVTYVPVAADGNLDIDLLERELSADTALVSLLWANNETGVLFPVDDIAAATQRAGVPLHLDAVQAVGKRTVDLAQLPVDLLSLSGHKLHAPQGVGALFVRKGLKLPPLLFGRQERNRRGGTENVPGIVALGAACQLIGAGLTQDTARMSALRDRLEQGVLARLPFARINGVAVPRLPNTSNIRFGTLPAEVLLSRLEAAGVYASGGAACSAAGQEPSHVLTALGLTRDEALACVRFSLSRDTTAAEVDYVLEILPDIVQRLAAAA